MIDFIMPCQVKGSKKSHDYEATGGDALISVVIHPPLPASADRVLS
jgi:hypothetical protein